MSILVVEDNPVSAKIIEFNLKKHGYQTIVAQTGREALECLESTVEIQLIIADIMMPELDGLRLLEEIKGRSEWKGIPVIMCTGLSDVETVQKAVEVGCRHYVVKPIKAVQLLGKVREALEDEKPVLKEKSRVMAELGLDRESYREAAGAFAALVDDTIPQLERQIQGGSVSGISIALSNLSEGASLIGAERVRGVLDRLATQSEGVDLKEENSEYPLLLRELKILKRVLPSEPLSATPSAEKEIEDDDTEKPQAEDSAEPARNE